MIIPFRTNNIQSTVDKMKIMQGSSKHVIDIIMIFIQVNRNSFNTLELTLSSLKIRIIVVRDVTEPQKTNVNFSISGKKCIW